MTITAASRHTRSQRSTFGLRFRKSELLLLLSEQLRRQSDWFAIVSILCIVLPSFVRFAFPSGCDYVIVASRRRRDGQDAYATSARAATAIMCLACRGGEALSATILPSRKSALALCAPCEFDFPEPTLDLAYF
jgi:hypothetical protein